MRTFAGVVLLVSGVCIMMSVSGCSRSSPDKTPVEELVKLLTEWVDDDDPLGPVNRGDKITGKPESNKAVTLDPEERRRLTFFPNEGMSVELLDRIPLWEIIIGSVGDKKPRTAARLYDDGSYFVYSDSSGSWRKLGILPFQPRERIVAVLESPAVQGAYADSGGVNPVTKASRLYRVTVGGETCEMVYGRGHAGIDPVLLEVALEIGRELR